MTPFSERMGAEKRRLFFELYARELKTLCDDVDVRGWYNANAAVSMCHRDTLVAMGVLAQISDGAIVEFGPYVGGTTIALARGAKLAGRRVLTVEKGGAYAHPVIPSADIIADLRANLGKLEVSDTVTIIESDYSNAEGLLEKALAGSSIGVFLVDADGHFTRSFEVVRRFLAPNAIVVIDDYRAPFAPEKEVLTRPQVDALVSEGALTSWGTLAGVTWIGQVGRRDIPRPKGNHVTLVSQEEVEKVTGSSGHLRCLRLPPSWQNQSDDATDGASPLLLFENGVLVGPAHSPHALVAEFGGGGYSHWRDALWFSSSDDRPPEKNERTYTARLGDEELNFSMQRNPHFDDDRVVWDDAYSGLYAPVAYEDQFDGQWKLFLEGQEGFVRHTGVDTSDAYIEDRIEELTGVPDYLTKKKPGLLSKLVGARRDDATTKQRRSVGGKLYLEPKFSIDHWRGRRCIDIGCGAGRWTRTLVELGATVKSVEMSEHGLRSTKRFNADVEKLDLFDIGPGRPDLHEAFDFTLCWGVVMCTHDPLLAFRNVAKTVKPGGELYLMVYAPTYHASEFVTSARKRYHRQAMTFQQRLDFVYELAGDDRANAINYLDMLNTEYNWTIDEETLREWARKEGFEEPHFLNAAEPHKGAHHVLYRKRSS